MKTDHLAAEVTNLADTPVIKYLYGLNLDFDIIHHEPCPSLLEATKLANIPIEYVLRVVSLKDAAGFIMAILPVQRLLDFKALCDLLNRELEPVSPKEINGYYPGCEPQSYPPLPSYFKHQAIFDNSIDELQKVYFQPGCHNAFIEIKVSEFKKLLDKSFCGNFSSRLTDLNIDPTDDPESNIVQFMDKFIPNKMQNRVGEIQELPPIPKMADQILKLSVDPDADAEKLAKIIEVDPSLSAQLLAWSRSAYYGFPGKINSVREAIVKVLGFDLVLNLALAIAVGSTMKVPHDGPIGLRAYWRHSIYCASFIEQLVKRIPGKKRPIAGLAYLAGLLHNFGYLILGQIFPPQFFLLNKFIEVNPYLSVKLLRAMCLGVGHEQIASWLFQNWHMPREIIQAARCHHQEEYADSNAAYSLLVLIANRALKRMSIGDAINSYIPSPVLDYFDLTEADIEHVLEYLLEQQEDLDALTSVLSA